MNTPTTPVDNLGEMIIYHTDDGKAAVVLYARDGQVWMNQKQMAALFATSAQNIGQHISNILSDNELSQNSVIKDYFTTATDGKQYKVTFYSLDMILAVGFRVRSKRGTQFRQWANKNLREYMVKGFVIDDQRLKNPNGRPDYFDELLARIRDIRASEQRFYQKVRELFALSSDYDKTDKATQMFFAETQNKLIYAVTHQTAAELILSRANPNIDNMGLTSWKGKIVRKQDIYISKNYLTEDEIDSLNRLVNIFLESAEMRVKDRHDLTIDYWRNNVDNLLTFQQKDILRGAGSISSAQMEKRVEGIYNEFNQHRKALDAIEADRSDEAELQAIEQQILHRPTDGSK